MNYAEGQHRMICELLGVSDDQDAAGASAYEAVIALQAGRNHIERVSERMTEHAKASRRELDEAKEQAMKVLVASLEDGTPFVMLSEAKWVETRSEGDRLRALLDVACDQCGSLASGDSHGDGTHICSGCAVFDWREE